MDATETYLQCVTEYDSWQRSPVYQVHYRYLEVIFRLWYRYIDLTDVFIILVVGKQPH